MTSPSGRLPILPRALGWFEIACEGGATSAIRAGELAQVHNQRTRHIVERLHAEVVPVPPHQLIRHGIHDEENPAYLFRDIERPTPSLIHEVLSQPLALARARHAQARQAI